MPAFVLAREAVVLTDRLGPVTLDVAYRSQVATFTVTDTGPGIAAGELSRIFDPFERGTVALGKAPGLGLGLTITRLLANLMGGDVTAESTVGQGSRFTVRVLLSAISDAKGTVPAPAPEPTGYLGARRTILVVDDEEAHRELMVEILRPLGFVVLTAGDGPAALELVRDIRPDLFLLDIQMPGGSGMPAVAPAMRAFDSSSILFEASLKAAAIRSSAISGSVSTLGSMRTLRHSLAPLRVTLTMPPPALPVTSSAAISCCTRCMFSCIFCACCISWAMFPRIS